LPKANKADDEDIDEEFDFHKFASKTLQRKILKQKKILNMPEQLQQIKVYNVQS